MKNSEKQKTARCTR